MSSLRPIDAAGGAVVRTNASSNLSPRRSADGVSAQPRRTDGSSAARSSPHVARAAREARIVVARQRAPVSPDGDGQGDCTRCGLWINAHLSARRTHGRPLGCTWNSARRPTYERNPRSLSDVRDRPFLATWPKEALLISLRLAVMLGQMPGAANDNGRPINETERPNSSARKKEDPEE